MAVEQKRTRVTRYCPKPEDINFKLKCEWDKCEEIATSVDTYIHHVDQHINDYLFSKKLFVQPNQQTMLSLECKWRECDVDTEKFDSISTYERHIRYHAFHTKLKFIGQTVFEELRKKSQDSNTQIHECTFDRQSRNLIPELPFKFECAWLKCDFNTDNPELFYRHVKAHLQDYKDIWKTSKKNKTDLDQFKNCRWSDCEFEVKNINRLTEHLRHHAQEKVVACYTCGALFSTFTKYLDHCSRTSSTTQTHTTITSNKSAIQTTLINTNINENNTNLIQYQCSHCNKKFLTQNLLKEHIRKHINKYKCSLCDMTCIDINDLKKHHLYKHTTDKPFKCSICPYACKTDSDLNKHINIKHRQKYEYECNECDYKVKSLNLIKKHIYKYHLNVAKYTYMYKCHVCEKIYTNGSTLSIHLKNIHKYKWPSGHSRFRYKLDNDGYYRLQTLRYESIELVEKLNKEKEDREKQSFNYMPQTTATTTTGDVSEVLQPAMIDLNQQNNVMFQNGVVAAVAAIDDDRQFDFDDEDEIEDEDFMDLDDDDGNNFGNNPQPPCTSQSIAGNSNEDRVLYQTFDNFKVYLIQRLIDDETKMVNQ